MMSADLGEASQTYARLSPVEYAKHVEAPVLFLQGDDDQRCSVGQSEEMFASLVHAGHERSMMVIYPGGSHSLASSGKPAHRKNYHLRVVKWIDTYG